MSEKINNGCRQDKLRQKTPQQALSALMRYCARAERSSGDALRLMRNWNIAAADAEEIMARLLKERFIDDSRFAEAYARDKARFSGWGPHKIRMGLRGKGVAPDIINAAIGGIDRAATAEKLRSMLDKKAAGVTGTVYERKGKLVRFGLSRGFDYDTVTTVCNELIKDE